MKSNVTAGIERLAGKYLTFTLGSGSYAINVRKIREIIRRTRITPLPNMPAYVGGVINLRNRIVPVFDLGLRLGLDAVTASDHTCIVVTDVVSQAGARAEIGLVVDDVEEVTTLTSSEIEQPPEFGAGVDADHLLGIAKIKGTVKALLDIDRIVAAEAFKSFEATNRV